MPRFGWRKIPHVFTAIAASILALASCLAVTIPAQAASSLALVILPDQGENAIYSFVNSATSSINVTIYELKDTTLVNDLIAREKAGVTVHVILDQAQKSYDSAAYSALTAGGVGVVYSSTSFTYTHQKTITVDSKESYSSAVTEVENAGAKVTGYSSSTGFYIHAKTIIADYGTSSAKAFAGSENFSANSLNDNRELGLITTDSGVVSGLESTFTGDFTGSAAKGPASSARAA